MNDLKERNKQIDTLLDDIIASDDAVASAEKAQTVYELVSSEHLSENVKESLSAFQKSAEEQRRNNEDQLKRLERRRSKFYVLAIICAMLYPLAWVFEPSPSFALTVSSSLTLAAFISAVYERRISSLEMTILRQSLRTTEAMASGLVEHGKFLVELRKFRQEMFPEKHDEAP